MSEAQEPSSRSTDVTRLLTKAVKGLPEAEQRAVFGYFFEQGIGMAQPSFLGRLVQAAAQPPWPAGHGSWHEPEALTTLVTAQKPMGSRQITIPVRLSEAQHQRLKRWAGEHNFPMAVVVRGLIERFLDDWEERAA